MLTIVRRETWKTKLVIDLIAILAVHSSRLTNDHETEENRCGTTALESTTRTNEQTSANGTSPIEGQSVCLRISCIFVVGIKTHMAIICICLPFKLLCRVFVP